MFSARIAAACLTVAAVFAPLAGAEKFDFEPHPKAVEKGRDPQLAVRVTGDLYLLNVEGNDLILRTSSDGGDSFDEKVRVNDTGTVASMAQSTPRMILQGVHELYCLWTSRNAQGRTALRFSRSVDWGRSFEKSVPVDSGDGKNELFYNMVVTSRGTILVAWLNETGLMLARSVNGGRSFETATQVAGHVCSCCRPAFAVSRNDDLYLSWRCMFPDGVRDMVVARSQDDGMSFGTPSRVAHDDWRINACPHAGDTMVVLGNRLYVSWNTVRNDRRWLYMAWSEDGGKHFSTPVNAAAGVLDANHSQFVSFGDTAGLLFQARPGSGDAGWSKLHTYFRQVTATGALLALQDLGHTAGSATYPVAIYEHPNHLFVAWTERSDTDASVVLTRGRSGGIADAP